MRKHRLGILFAGLGFVLFTGRVVSEPWPAPAVDGLADVRVGTYGPSWDES